MNPTQYCWRALRFSEYFEPQKYLQQQTEKTKADKAKFGSN